ncbi:hypothetical protein KIN20_034123 [Parelaphostrongylus tenuis]|uniref:Uncharacterized protein n=1 Tax=Parelaphostrongylus tenuis TaxID=148309 RepID=A0AAD5R9C6_PARTN|nr:hypothetical protein KIN20_034123 [Parelaphostrongylus tenuis]
MVKEVFRAKERSISAFSLPVFGCAQVMDRKNQCIAVIELHKTVMKATDIVEISCFQTSKCLQSHETFQSD